ncbi:hypothetical protein BGW39_001621 [Mortierella sp. 14UC]|nr:hypothetical protein BGW39_001621 [Mortierella sp. 14UC]
MHYQAFKVGPDGAVIELKALFHEEHLVVPWDDIVFRFPGVHCIQLGNRVVPFVRKPGSLEYMSPRCIEYLPDTALDVIMVEASPSSPMILNMNDVAESAGSEDVSSLPSSYMNHQRARSSPVVLSMSDEAESAGSEEVYALVNSDMAVSDGPVRIDAAFASKTKHRSVDTDTPAESTNTHSMDNPNLDTIDPADNVVTIDTETTTTATIAGGIETVSTQINQTASPNSFVESRRFMERLHSVARSFGQLMIKGQDEQALVVRQESESIKQEMSRCFENLHTEVAKNVALQNQILELQKTAMDTDQLILDLQNMALEKLVSIQSKVAAILTQTYELHEHPIPRLFIILPKEDISKTERIGMGIAAPFVDRFRLNFLCECGEHTKSGNGSNSNISHNIHLARHEGYDLDRPTEFFKKYGTYVLALLQMLKYGVMAAGLVVAPLDSAVKNNEMEAAVKVLEGLSGDLVPKVDFSIKYLKGFTENQAGLNPDTPAGSSSAEASPMDRMDQLIATAEGHIKWVCLDHYRENYGSSTTQEFRELVTTTFKGKYDENKGSAQIILRSPDDAELFYRTLLASRFILHLDVELAWNSTFEHLKTFKEMIQKSNIHHLQVDLRFNHGPTSDILNRGRRSEPLFQLMAGVLEELSMQVPSFEAGFESFQPAIKLHKRLAKVFLAGPDPIKKTDFLCLLVSDVDEAYGIIQPILRRHPRSMELKIHEAGRLLLSAQFSSEGEVLPLIEAWIPDITRVKHVPLNAIRILTMTLQAQDDSKTLIDKVVQQCSALEVLEICYHKAFSLSIFAFGAISAFRNLRLTNYVMQSTEYTFPLIRLDLSCQPVVVEGLSPMKPLFEANPTLRELSFLVTDIVDAFKMDAIALMTAGTLSKLTLEDSSKSKASFSFDNDCRISASCTLYPVLTLQSHRLVLALANNPRQPSEIDTLSVEDLPQLPYRIHLHINAIDIRCGANYLSFFLRLLDFLSIQRCTLREVGNNVALFVDGAAGILTIGSEAQVQSGNQLPGLKTILCAYPSLTTVNVTVDSIAKGFHLVISVIDHLPHLSKLKLKQKGVGPKVTILFHQHVAAGSIALMELVIRSLKQLPTSFHSFLTRLTISGEVRNWKSDDLDQIPLAACGNLAILELKCPVAHFPRIFQHVHEQALAHAALIQLKLWDGTPDGILAGTNINRIDTVQLRLQKVKGRNSHQLVETFATMSRKIRLEIDTFEMDQKVTLPLIRQVAQLIEQRSLRLKHLDMYLSNMKDSTIFDEILAFLESCDTDLIPAIALVLRDDSIFKNACWATQGTPLLEGNTEDGQGHRKPSALGKILAEFTTRLVVTDAGLYLFMPEVQLAALGPPRRLKELDCRRTAHHSGIYCAQWIQSLFEHAKKDPSEQHTASSDATTTPTTARIQHLYSYDRQADRRPLTPLWRLMLYGMDFQDNRWKELLESMDYVSLRVISLGRTNFKDEELILLVSVCRAQVQSLERRTSTAATKPEEGASDSELASDESTGQDEDSRSSMRSNERLDEMKREGLKIRLYCTMVDRGMLVRQQKYARDVGMPWIEIVQE